MLAPALVIALMSGCSSGTDAPRPAPDADSGTRFDRESPFRPEELRVHPLTRLELTPPRGAPYVDAHVEFLDAADDPVKTTGDLSFILYSGGRVGQSLQQIASWGVAEFDDPANNARAFDHVTRTYRFRLEGLPTPLDPQARLVLEANLLTPDRRRISARHSF